LPGEIFYQLYELFTIHPGWMIFIFVSILYFLFYLTFFHLIKKIKLDKFFIFAIFSPIAFYFPVLNSKASGHKDIIFLCFFSIFCFFSKNKKALCKLSYGFGWTVPICCGLNFKPGISRVIERAVYYSKPLIYQ